MAQCILVLALGGLGTRFSELGLESPPRPVPKVSLTAMHSRLGAIDTYAEVGSRPLMNQNRQPTTVTLSAQGASNADLDVTLSSVLITSNLKLALLTDNKDSSSKRVKLGDVVEGSNWRLVNLEP